MTAMRILVFAPFYPPDPTGSSIFAHQQVEEFRRLGHQVLVVTNRLDRKAPKVNPGPGTGDDPSTVRLPSKRVNLGRITWNYGIPVSTFGFLRRSSRRRLREFAPDVVVVHSTLFDLSLMGLLWSRRHRRRAVVVSHTALWHDNPVVAWLMRLYGSQVLARIIRFSRARVVCVDKWTHDNALEVFTDSTNCVTIPVSVVLGTMSSGDASKIRQRHGLGDGPVVLSLGHVVPLRNRVNLVNSLPLLVESFPKLKVVIVGMVKDETFLEHAARLGVTDHLVIVGAVPHHEIADYLAAADVEIHDLDGKGLGITSVEAMDAGVPIVAWAIDDNYPQFSLRSYGPSGFIEDGTPESIAARVVRILNDREFRDKVVDSQRRLVDEIYSCESVTRQYLEILTAP